MTLTDEAQRGVEKCLARANVPVTGDGDRNDPKPTAPRRPAFFLHEPPDNRTEAEKQAEGVNWLLRRDYWIRVAGQYLKKVQCQECLTWFWPAGFGNSVGLPDVWVAHPTRWPARVWTPLEYKRYENSPRSPKQVELVEANLSVFVWSLPMMIEAVHEFESRSLGIEPHPDLTEYLTRHGLLAETEDAS